MASKRKHTDRTYEEKYKVIKFCDESPGIKRSDIVLKFAIKPQTLSHMMKVETKKTVFNVMENPPDARKGTIKRAENVRFPTSMPLLLFGSVSNFPSVGHITRHTSTVSF